MDGDSLCDGQRLGAGVYELSAAEPTLSPISPFTAKEITGYENIGALFHGLMSRFNMIPVFYQDPKKFGVTGTVIQSGLFQTTTTDSEGFVSLTTSPLAAGAVMGALVCGVIGPDGKPVPDPNGCMPGETQMPPATGSGGTRLNRITKCTEDGAFCTTNGCGDAGILGQVGQANGVAVRGAATVQTVGGYRDGESHLCFKWGFIPWSCKSSGSGSNVLKIDATFISDFAGLPLSATKHVEKANTSSVSIAEFTFSGLLISNILQVFPGRRPAVPTPYTTMNDPCGGTATATGTCAVGICATHTSTGSGGQTLAFTGWPVTNVCP